MKKYIVVFLIILSICLLVSYLGRFFSLLYDQEIEFILKYSSWIFVFIVSLFLILFVIFLNRGINISIGNVILFKIAFTIIYYFTPIHFPSIKHNNFVEVYENIYERPPTKLYDINKNTIVWGRSYKAFFPLSTPKDTLAKHGLSYENEFGYIRRYGNLDEMYLSHSHSIYWQYSIIRAFYPINVESLNIGSFWYNIFHIGPFFIIEITIRTLIPNIIFSFLLLILFAIIPQSVVGKRKISLPFIS